MKIHSALRFVFATLMFISGVSAFAKNVKCNILVPNSEGLWDLSPNLKEREMELVSGRRKVLFNEEGIKLIASDSAHPGEFDISIFEDGNKEPLVQASVYGGLTLSFKQIKKKIACY